VVGLPGCGQGVSFSAIRDCDYTFPPPDGTGRTRPGGSAQGSIDTEASISRGAYLQDSMPMSLSWGQVLPFLETIITPTVHSPLCQQGRSLTAGGTGIRNQYSSTAQYDWRESPTSA
jgi:hypothetical protein